MKMSSRSLPLAISVIKDNSKIKILFQKGIIKQKFKIKMVN